MRLGLTSLADSRCAREHRRSSTTASTGALEHRDPNLARLRLLSRPPNLIVRGSPVLPTTQILELRDSPVLWTTAERQPRGFPVLASTTNHKPARVARARRQRRSLSMRPADQRFDGAWAALHGRLVACTRLVDGPESPRAAALLATLFPTGLAFVTLGYEAEWVHSRELLTRIAEEKHTPELVELAGQRFVDAVHAAHKGLGEALGLEGEQKVEASLMVGDQLVALGNAIAKYARLFAGTVIDEPSLEVFRSAMAPLDAHRESNRRSGTTEDAAEGEDVDADAEADGIDIDEPLPPVPALAP